MSRLEEVVRAIPGLRAGASTDRAGLVHDAVGDADFDTACATVAMSLPTLESAADLLGLGELQVVSYLHGEHAAFVRVDGERAEVYLGGAAKSPDATAVKLLAARPAS